VHIEWTTGSEVNNYGWDIELKKQNLNWKKIGFVEGIGNSAVSNVYTFTDNNIKENGKYYYRIKQLDFDGSFSYSNAVEVDINRVAAFDLAQNYPNPFNPATVINYQIPNKEKVSLIVYDVLGNQVKVLVDEVKDAGSYQVNFDAGKLATGVYMYRLKSGNLFISKKMLLIK
jgi:hypothetical protein